MAVKHMTKSYIGFRVEIASRNIKDDLDKIIDQYNSDGDFKMFDPYVDGKITVERTKVLLIARGEKDKKPKQDGTTNFSIMIPIKTSEAERVAQIVNVLGNGKLIRERIHTFMNGSSVLNKIPELHGLQDALKNMEKYIRGFIKSGWYYSPEVIING